MKRFCLSLVAAVAVGVLGGCSASTPADPEVPVSTATASAAPTSSSATPTPSQTTTPTADAALQGKTIAIDPGHNGGNSSNPREIKQRVPDGRGGKKACNTVGATSSSGFPEHTFNWELATQLRTILECRGAQVIVSRDSDSGVGPCVNERGAFAKDADLLLSIHVNGSENTRVHGYHLIIAPDVPVADAQTEQASAQLAQNIDRALSEAGFSRNSAYGDVVKRKDLATLNTAPIPAVLLEAGEMRNPQDARMLESESDRERMAEALATAIAHSLPD